MNMNWKEIIKEAKDILLQKKNFWFFLVFYIFGTGLNMNIIGTLFGLLTIMNIIPGSVLPGGISIVNSMSHIVYGGSFIILFLLFMTLIAQGGFIQIISRKETSVKRSMKNTLFKIKTLLCIIIIITSLQFLIISIINMNQPFLDSVLPSLRGGAASTTGTSLIAVDNTRITEIYGDGFMKFNFLQVLANFGKPFIISPALLNDFCLLDTSTCGWAISNFYLGVPLLQVFLYMLVSIFTLFVIQEIMLNNSGTINSIKNSVTLVRRNLNDVLNLYIISLLSFVIFAWMGTLVSYILLNFFGLYMLLFYYSFLALGFMFVVALQTVFYLKIRRCTQ